MTCYHSIGFAVPGIRLKPNGPAFEAPNQSRSPSAAIG